MLLDLYEATKRSPRHYSQNNTQTYPRFMLKTHLAEATKLRYHVRLIKKQFMRDITSLFLVPRRF